MPDDRGQVSHEFDRFLHARLPLPLARLYARAANAVTARNRLLSAYYLHEATLKLAVSVEIMRLLGRSWRDPAAERMLERLALPSIGVWSTLLPILAQEDFEESGPAALLAARRDDLPSLAHAVRTLSGGEDPPEGPMAVQLLYEQLPDFRHRIVTGGENPAPAEATSMAAPLLDAFLQIVTRTPLLESLSLAVVESVARLGEDQAQVKWLDLTGPTPVRTAPEVVPFDETLKQGHAFTKTPEGGWLSLHPLLVFREDEFLPELLFVDATDPDRGLVYVDYVTGKVEGASIETSEVSQPDLGMREFLARVRHEPIDREDYRRMVHESVKHHPVPEVVASTEARRFGEYELLGELGRGGMGIVYLARQSTVGRLVALKIFPPALSADAVASARFEREIAALGRCDHPNVVKVIAAGKAEGTSYYAMELVAGATLAAVGRSLSGAGSVAEAISTASNESREVFEGVPELPPVPSSNAVPVRKGETYRELSRMMAEAARGVHHLHENAILHRDLKPGNLMVSAENQRVVVMDLGLAAVEGMSVTQEQGAVIGTLRYMAPEQLQGSSMEVDRRSEVYALGATLYELVTGAPAHDGNTQARVIQQVLHEEPRRASALAGDVPRDLDAILLRCLAKDPSGRYPSALELALDLERFARDEAVTARPPSAREQLLRLVAQYRAYILIVAAGLLALVTLGVVSFLEISKERRDVLRLSDLESLHKLEERARGLWPAFPRRVPDMLRWKEEAARLVDRIERHRATLEELKRRPTAETEASGATGLPALEERRERIEAELAAALEDGSAPEATQELRERLGAVKEQIEERRRSPAMRTVVFANDQDQWWHDTLEGLVTELVAFRDTTIADVERRIESARALERTMERFADAWEATVREVEEDRETYGGLRLALQTGLVPVGCDPDTGLQEFAHTPSGAIPERDAHGRLLLDETSALVFVLLPGGTFRMGAIAGAEDGASTPEGDVNLDPFAQQDEGPCHRIELDPFFVSKYEMTQAQWLGLAGENPSRYGPDFDQGGIDITLRHPVESVSWDDCRVLLDQLGLDFPTEAQWEYAARAGTRTVWSTGDRDGSLQGYANLADRTLFDSGIAKGIEFDHWLVDGHILHAPVGRFRPNPFGLHDVHGNVWEWCKDRKGPYEQPVRPGDGERLVFEGDNRVDRGGHFLRDAIFARSANRDFQISSSSHGGLGLRPARAIER